MVRTVDDEGVVDDEEAADEERVTCLFICRRKHNAMHD